VSLAQAYAALRRLGRPVVTTDDAAVRLGISVSGASHTLVRLSAIGLVQRLRRGLWSLEAALDPMVLPEYLTAPYPAYVSFQSALYLHGMIEQMARVIYVASLGRPQRLQTTLGTYSVHRLAPEFFGGYRLVGESGVKLATPEKALLDVLYLSSARSRLFARLPELEIPPRFSVREAQRWIARIPSAPRRTMVAKGFEAILASQDEGRSARTR
jgi:predicted transcriptional regulator of viral defense system